MGAKGLVKRYEGWVYVVQWENDEETVKIGFSTDLKGRLGDFLTYSPHRLIVVKAFRAEPEEERLLHEKFQAVRGYGEWFALSQSLAFFLKEQCRCNTKEAKKDFGSAHKERILWKPMLPAAQDRLDAAHKSKKLPGFINNARRYILWAIRSIHQGNYVCDASGIINHPANSCLYEAKTIYNTLAFLLQEGLITKDEEKLYSLTDRGSRGLDLLEEQWLERRYLRKSVRSLAGTTL
jgi:hypothetical protein